MATQQPHSGLEVAPDTKPYLAPQSPAPTSHVQPYYGQSPESMGGPPGGYVGKEKTICGVRRPTFWLALLLAFVTIASGIGGGLGGSLAVRSIRRKCSSSNVNLDTGSGTDSSGSNSNPDAIYITRTRTITSTLSPDSTPTATSDITVPTSGFLALDCPSLDGNNIQAFGSTFKVVCGQDSAGPDIISIVAYSLLDCARACATYNANGVAASGKTCVAATFNSYLAYVSAHQGTCWLKTASTKGSELVDGLTGVDKNTYAQVVLQ
ncbi:hypothetical protein ONS95_011387 [Cadophora gregata]|uniref:uncharacterized protein n=1 Tax=Cadophora gregata TaxID=51156 RepID=UPI0026DDB34A|nr:uncharacterized protein ONS95_011387 [Cadophora gregata]KAK0119963.1 hypothetical protein ONS95_011387 [Cadophora gregata]KAK0120998.1 hypothetical protein ONS96_011189 [Cadophora gregata f. sp. sojae]